uniref:Transport and Golgi organization protein 11 n=1 Tax=Lygus hesperus TaxID=30085 RepID=A0A0A9XND1_LYGHE
MSNSTSPTRFMGEVDHFYDPNFTAEISQKMRVPKRINVDGVSDLPNVGRPEAHWMPAEKLEMFVPEKIVVADEHMSDFMNGGDEYHGIKPITTREMSLDNTIMPREPPSSIRVQTPPRVLTIDQTYSQEEYGYPPTPVGMKENIVRKYVGEQRNDISSLSNMMNDSTVAEGMTLNEEVVHLRRQLAKLNRRVMSIELDNLQRQNKDKIIYALGLAYFFFKTVLWLSRS